MPIRLRCWSRAASLSWERMKNCWREMATTPACLRSSGLKKSFRSLRKLGAPARRAGFGCGRISCRRLHEALFAGAQLSWQHLAGLRIARHNYPGLADVANAGDDLFKLLFRGAVRGFERHIEHDRVEV